MHMDRPPTDRLGRRLDPGPGIFPDRPFQKSKKDRRRAVPAVGSSRLEEEADSSTPVAAVDTRNVPAVTGSNALPAEEDSRPQAVAQRKPPEQVADRRASAPEVDSSTPSWVEDI